MNRILKKNQGPKAKKETFKFKIDCKEPADDSVIDVNDLAEFLKQRIKVNGKKGNLGDVVSVETEKSNLIVTAEPPFSKRYLKYLTKKYLKQHKIRDYLHVIASDKTTYKVKYFNIQNEENEEEAE